ncbi:hypothetical protein [Rhodohalobacter mucosus]|uniref:Uncharacterized protein n=1 Tax=Rhodohalobacter mucosus TaxID=2079485 RepID=A0A316TPF7_9BACT|nr:hypothetical protein [Rhodohalobacter mucosus]PWN06290.1 hypothetical protein DDZ15_10725 [Rhodohalobacter mucosus]
MTLSNLILSTVLAFAATSDSYDNNPNKHSNPDTLVNSLTIHEGNLACFQDLNCLKSNNPFNQSNLEEVILGSNMTGNYVVEGKSKNEEVYAVYNARGELLRATVIQRNVALPKHLCEVLVSDEFKSWTMIGNEVEIRNFDKNKITYKVVLSRDGEVRVEHFDQYAKPIDRIS